MGPIFVNISLILFCLSFDVKMFRPINGMTAILDPSITLKSYKVFLLYYSIRPKLALLYDVAFVN